MSGLAIARGRHNRHCGVRFRRIFHFMPDQIQPGARARITPVGLLFLAITSVGWGLNWPVTKALLSQLPPLTLRGATGVAGRRRGADVMLVAAQPDVRAPAAR